MRRLGQYLLLFLTSTSLLTAGEYSLFSPGIEVDCARSVGSASSIGSNSNINSTKAPTLLGVGLTGQLRLGNLYFWDLQSIVLAPTIGLRLGRTKHHIIYNNKDNYDANTGGLQKISDVESTSITKFQELYLVAPLRWYCSTHNAVDGGIFVEAGPLVCRTTNKVHSTINSILANQKVSRIEHNKVAVTEHGFTVGIGVTRVQRDHQFTYGLAVQSIHNKQPESLPDTKAAVKSKPRRIATMYISWTF